MGSDTTDMAFIGLGSNLGDSIRLVQEATRRLEPLSRLPLVRSSLWRTRPVDCPPGSLPFINAVVGLAPWPEETPHSLLAKLKALEREFGRQPKTVLNEPRPLDLDIIAWGDLRLETPELVVPHPRAHLRRFVLAPLAELVPCWVFPGQTRTVEQLLENLGGDSGSGLEREVVGWSR
jgi:2-amino-4-hydroxy-6-hydroxymethyldihydropteridine diphosphokinase